MFKQTKEDLIKELIPFEDWDMKEFIRICNETETLVSEAVEKCRREADECCFYFDDCQMSRILIDLIFEEAKDFFRDLCYDLELEFGFKVFQGRRDFPASFDYRQDGLEKFIKTIKLIKGDKVLKLDPNAASFFVKYFLKEVGVLSVWEE